MRKFYLIYMISTIIENSDLNIDIAIIIKFLLNYDKNQKNQFCCINHSLLIKDNISIMNPELSNKLKPVEKLLEIIFDKKYKLTMKKYEENKNNIQINNSNINGSNNNINNVYKNNMNFKNNIPYINNSNNLITNNNMSNINNKNFNMINAFNTNNNQYNNNSNFSSCSNMNNNLFVNNTRNNNNSKVNSIFITFTYEPQYKQVFIDSKDNDKFSDVISLLEKKYNWIGKIPNKYYFFENKEIQKNQMNIIIRDLGIKDNSNIIIKDKNY